MNIFYISDGIDPSQLPDDIAHMAHFVNAIVTANAENLSSLFPDPRDPDFALYIYYYEEGDEWVVSSDHEDGFPAVIWKKGSFFTRNTITGENEPTIGIVQAVYLLCKYYGIYDCECKLV